MNVRPDPTFHASPKLAMEAPAENFAFTVMLDKDSSQHDGLAVVDLRDGSDTYGEIVHTVMTETAGDEFHHFGWNACSSSLSPLSGHAFLERRYLIVPGIRSSRIFIFDVKEPLKAKFHKIIEPEELFEKTGYSRPHTIHCGPEGIYVSTLGEEGTDCPPGILSWIAKPSRLLAGTRWIAAHKTSTMTSGGTCHKITWSALSGVCRRNTKMVSCQRIFCPTNMVIRSISGTCAHTRISRPSTLVKITKWHWKFARRMIRPNLTAFVALWLIRPICKVLSLRGGVMTTANGSPRRPSPLIHAPKIPTICLTC